jgi:5-methylthioadenosine/S-adenosylhomocysteine deaminase
MMVTVTRNADDAVAWDATKKNHIYATGGDIAFDNGNLVFAGLSGIVCPAREPA